MLSGKVYFLLIVAVLLSLTVGQKESFLTTSKDPSSQPSLQSSQCCCSTIQSIPTVDIENHADALHYGAALLHRQVLGKSWLKSFSQVNKIFVMNVLLHYKKYKKAKKQFIKKIGWQPQERLLYRTAQCVKLPFTDPKLDLKYSKVMITPYSKWYLISGPSFALPFKGTAPATRSKGFPSATVRHLDYIRGFFKKPPQSLTDNNFIIIEDGLDDDQPSSLQDAFDSLNCFAAYADWFKRQIHLSRVQTRQPLVEWLFSLQLPQGAEEEVYSRWMSVWIDATYGDQGVEDLICDDGFTGLCDKTC